jgi:hypothetical protein
MSYSNGLRGVTASDTYPSNTFVAGGFQVVGLSPSAAAAAVVALRAAMAASFPIGSVAPPATSGPNTGRATVGWGPAYGVASGRLYVVAQTNRDGVSGADINNAFAAVARDLATRLHLTVHLTNAHTLGDATPLPTLTPDQGTPDSTVSPLLIGGIAASAIAVSALAYALLRRRPVARNRGRRA